MGDADVGTLISVRVSYTDGEGTNEGPLTSAQTAAVVNVNDAPVGLPAITGTVTEDQILTADISGISDNDGLGAFSYQWLRGGSLIAGATASTYTLGDADVGTLISVRVSYTDGEGTNEGPLTSAQTAAVVNVNDAPVGLPAITGTVTEDQILTADISGISDNDGLGAFSYQWLRGGSLIAGATAATYTLGDADVGTLISVRVSYTDGEGTNEGPLTSAQTAAVVNVNDAPVITSNGGTSSAFINIDENSTYVTTATSADIDGGAPVYSIIGGLDAALFSINPVNGELRFNAMPDFEHAIDVGGNNQYNLIMGVSDGNGGFDTQAISVNISDIEDSFAFPTDPETPPDPTVEIIPDPEGEGPGDGIIPPLDDHDPIDTREDTGPFLPDNTLVNEASIDEAQDEAETDSRLAINQLAEPVELIEPEIDFDLKKLDRRALTAAMDQSLSELREHNIVLGTTPLNLSLAAGTLLTAGFVGWVIRGGALMSALLATMPMWRGFDPLLILVSQRSKNENNSLEEDHRSKVERVFESASKANTYSKRLS